MFNLSISLVTCYLVCFFFLCKLIAFVDLILAQTTVGSVVKIEDDDDEGLFVLLQLLIYIDTE